MPTNKDTLAIVDEMLGGKNESSTTREIVNEMFLLEERKKKERNPYIPPHASEFKESFEGAWQYCIRKSILQEFYFYPEEEFPINRVRINELGWYIHLMIQRIWKNSTRARAVEIEVTHKHPKYGVFYTIDIVSLFEELYGNDEVVVEIKSMNTNAFQAAIKKNSAEKMHPEGYKQAQIYMFLSNRKRAALFLYDKNTSDYHLEFFEYDSEFMKPYIDRIETRYALKLIFEASEGKKLPPKVCTDPNIPRACSCPVKDLCFMSKAKERESRKRDITHQQTNVSLIHEEVVE